jgi:hypothetical protein
MSNLGTNQFHLRIHQKHMGILVHYLQLYPKRKYHNDQLILNIQHIKHHKGNSNLQFHLPSIRLHRNNRASLYLHLNIHHMNLQYQYIMNI